MNRLTMDQLVNVIHVLAIDKAYRAITGTYYGLWASWILSTLCSSYVAVIHVQMGKFYIYIIWN